jgi:hypothetical protein
MSPQRPAIWAGSRARPPVSECVSPGPTDFEAEGSKDEYKGSTSEKNNHNKVICCSGFSINARAIKKRRTYMFVAEMSNL